MHIGHTYIISLPFSFFFNQKSQVLYYVRSKSNCNSGVKNGEIKSDVAYFMLGSKGL
jgi:hypothetical protein